LSFIGPLIFLKREIGDECFQDMSAKQ